MFVCVRTLLLLAALFTIKCSSVCFPSMEKRAYVTTLSDARENYLKIQVLYRSLRMNNAKEDIVVIVLESLLVSNPKLEKELSSFGFKVYPIKQKMLEQYSMRSGLAIWAFELVQYERVVYLDPYSLVMESVDELFACAGYCASVHSKESPVVLEPSIKTFTSLSQNFQKSEADFFLKMQTIMNVDSCPIFSQEVAANAEISDQCFNKDSHVLFLTECHQLPVEYGVLSGGFAAQDLHKDLVCTSCGFEKPKIIMYPKIEDTYESFMKTKKAIVSKWDSVRSTIPIRPELKKESVFSFGVGVMVSFFVLYFHDTRCRLGSSKLRGSFDLAAGLPLETSTLSGVLLVWESFSCVTSSSLGGLAGSAHVVANRSSIFLFSAFLSVTFVASFWYHFSLIAGQYSSSFEWDPLAALAVGHVWTTLLLVTGLQLIDHCSEVFKRDSQQLFSQLAFCCVSIVVIVACTPWERHFSYVQAFVCVVAIATSCSYHRHPPSGPCMVQNTDMVVVLGASFVYYLMSYVLVLLNIPIVLRTVLIRFLGMIHYFVFLFVVISVTCGDHMSGIIRKATIHRNSSFSFVNCLRYSSQQLSRYCCLLKELVLRPLVVVLVCLAIILIVIYIKLFLARVSNLPVTSPYCCLRQRGKYLNAEGGVSSGCGAREAFEIEYPEDAVFSETFSQNYVCIHNTKPVPLVKRQRYNTVPSSGSSGSWWTTLFSNKTESTVSLWKMVSSDGVGSGKKRDKKYLFLSRRNDSRLFKRCVPGTQFVFILPPEKENKVHFCIYNSRSGNFLTSTNVEKKHCGPTEKWEVIPTHSYINTVNKVSHLLYPFKYSFTHQNPFSAIALMFVLVRVAQKVENYPYLKVSLFCTVALLFLHLFHVVAIWLIWGGNFKHMREYNTDAMLTFQKSLGVLTGPQYYRTISMLPDECPETLWFVALMFFSCTFPVFLVLLSCIQKRKLSAVDGEFLHMSRDSRDDIEESAEARVQSNKDLSFNVSIMSRVASCAIGSLLLEALLNLVVPVQFVASAFTVKSSCANFEDRFGIMSFDKEYMDTVILYVNVIFLMGIKYSTSPVFFAVCIVYTIVLYVLVWLTVECSYVLLISKFCITFAAWISISHKLSSHFEFLIIKASKVQFGRLSRHQSMPIISQQEVTRISSSPKYRQLSRQSSFFLSKEGVID